jgi:hypothetical protein
MAFGQLMMCRSILAFKKSHKSTFEKKGCNWKSVPMKFDPLCELVEKQIRKNEFRKRSFVGLQSN